MRICELEDCTNKYYCSKYCTKHYARWYTHGDPYKVLPRFIPKEPVSEATKAKISASTKGKKKSLEMRMKLSRAKQGAGALHLWKGGISPINKRIRRSAEYRIWRERVFERDNFTCQFCNVRGVKLNADHIKPFADYPELRFELDNGRTLCEPCHIKTPTFGRWS